MSFSALRFNPHSGNLKEIWFEGNKGRSCTVFWNISRVPFSRLFFVSKNCVTLAGLFAVNV